MATYQGTDKTDADTFLALCNKLQGYPRKGVHVGGGIHVPMPDVYSVGAPGWTATMSVTSPAFAVEVTDECVAAQKDSEARKKLSSQELTELDSKFSKVSGVSATPLGGSR